MKTSNALHLPKSQDAELALRLWRPDWTCFKEIVKAQTSAAATA
jgi:hypothetical protein